MWGSKIKRKTWILSLISGHQYIGVEKCSNYMQNCWIEPCVVFFYMKVACLKNKLREFNILMNFVRIDRIVSLVNFESSSWLFG